MPLAHRVLARETRGASQLWRVTWRALGNPITRIIGGLDFGNGRFFRLVVEEGWDNAVGRLVIVSSGLNRYGYDNVIVGVSCRSVVLNALLF